MLACPWSTAVPSLCYAIDPPLWCRASAGTANLEWLDLVAVVQGTKQFEEKVLMQHYCIMELMQFYCISFRCIKMELMTGIAARGVDALSNRGVVLFCFIRKAVRNVLLRLSSYLYSLGCGWFWLLIKRKACLRSLRLQGDVDVATGLGIYKH
ncbi:hypothetical protein VNO80_18511 [Phaseolus coccineus]|uniref:Uncharacterized protein n=1 Tax=Phaseolus coccineus TaxID=3886 RepID=A0AAN9QWJ3_PHACN